MNSMTTMYQCRMYSLVAQMEGMKAENQQRVSQGHSLAYTNVDFNGLAIDFERLADSFAECVNYD